MEYNPERAKQNVCVAVSECLYKAETGGFAALLRQGASAEGRVLSLLGRHLLGVLAHIPGEQGGATTPPPSVASCCLRAGPALASCFVQTALVKLGLFAHQVP